MNNDSLAKKAALLRSLHVPGKPLLLFNVWDAVSARIIEQAGYPAVATTSAGIAWSRGYADGECISRAEMLESVRAITRAVRVPVTADLEAAYGLSVDDARATAQGAIDAGAVGLNFEDAIGDEGLVDLDVQCERIKAMVEVGVRAGVPICINARTDPFLADIGPDSAWRLQESIRRAKAFLQAGATSVFVPGVTDEPTIGALTRAIPGPVNILASASAPPVSRLAQLGVARISVGGAAMAHALQHLRTAAMQTACDGTFAFASDRMTHAELNSLF